MKFCKKIFMAVTVIVFAGILNSAFAGEETVLKKYGLEAGGSFDVYSKYVWRGFTLDTDPVIQPGIELSGYGITLSLWSSFDVDNSDSLNSDEIDYAMDYTKEFEKFSISVGHTYYDFPGADLYSKEFYLGAAVSDVLLSPSLTLYYDYGDESSGGGDGYYVVLETSHSFTIIKYPEITLDLGANFGYNNELFISGEGQDISVTAGLSIPLTESLTFSPSIGYAMPFGDLKDENDGAQDNRFYGGVSLEYSF